MIVVIENQMKGIIDELTQKHLDLGMKASGDWIDSLEYEVVKNGDSYEAVIKGNAYTEQLTKGRPNGKRPPIAPLQKWVRDKFGVSGKQGLGIAFAVANKIAKSGTTWFEKGGSDLVDGVITRERIRIMQEEIGLAIAQQIKKELIRELQTA